MSFKITLFKNKLSYCLSSISPISTEQKQINISAVYEFILVFSFLFFFKPIFLSYVSFQSLMEIIFASTTIFIGIGWAYYSFTAQYINTKRWTYYNDIGRFLKVVLLTSMVHFCYIFIAMNYLYKDELKLNNWDFNRNIFLELIPCILFIGVFVYVLLKFVDYLKFTTHTNIEYQKNGAERNIEKISLNKNIKEKKARPIKISKGVFQILDLITLVRVGQNEIVLSCIVEFLFTVIIQIAFRPGFLKALSFVSLFEITVFSSFIFAFTRGLICSWSAKKINLKSWTYKKDILRFYKILAIATVIYYGYAHLIFSYWYRAELIQNHWDVNMNIFFPRLFYIFFIGTMTYLVSKFFDLVSFLYKNIQANNETENDFNLLPETEITNKSIITIQGKNKDEEVKVSLDNFIYLESYGHYIKVYTKINDEGETMTMIIRNSIQNVLESLIVHKNILQCHRSYIVNTDMIDCVEGNSKKANLKLVSSNVRLPLSRENYNLIKLKKQKISLN